MINGLKNKLKSKTKFSNIQNINSLQKFIALIYIFNI